jgi:hypothetical protein
VAKGPVWLTVALAIPHHGGKNRFEHRIYTVRYCRYIIATLFAIHIGEVHPPPLDGRAAANVVNGGDYSFTYGTWWTSAAHRTTRRNQVEIHGKRTMLLQLRIGYSISRVLHRLWLEKVMGNQGWDQIQIFSVVSLSRRRADRITKNRGHINQICQLCDTQRRH